MIFLKVFLSIIILIPFNVYAFKNESNTNNNNNNNNRNETISSNTVIVESKFLRNILLSFICLPIMISTLIGNMLVILAVVIVRKLHTKDNANNFLIVSLACSDFLVGVLVMPFAFYVEISEENKWHLGSILCDLWTISDVLLCTASILNLCAISIDRYFIILHSFAYTQRRNARLMFLMILVVWILSALTSIPPLFGWGRQQKELECTVSDDLKYQIYATLLAFYLPSALMIIVYINIYRAARKIKKREMQTAGRLNNFSNNNNNTNSISSKNNNNNSLQIRLESKNLTETPLLLYKNTAATNSNKKIFFSDVNLVQMTNNSESNNKAADRRTSYFNMISNGTGRLGRRVTQVFNNIKCSRESNSGASSTSSSKNQKATTTLGVIMGCFILCWLPFFILAVLKPIKLDNNRKLSDLVPKWLDSFLLWLGYFNSALNPVIYARFNREFRRPFIEILCFKCKNINERLRDEERKKMYPGCMSRNEIVNNLNQQQQQPSMNSINNLVECSNNNNNNNVITLDKITSARVEIETTKEKTITIDFNELKTVATTTTANNQDNSTKPLFNKNETDTLSSLNSITPSISPVAVAAIVSNKIKEELNSDTKQNNNKNNDHQRSKTSKKRKLHSNYPKISSDTIKKYSKPNKSPRLAYCTFNGNNITTNNNTHNCNKFSRQINVSPFMLSHITSYILNQKDLTSDSNRSSNTITTTPTSIATTINNNITTTNNKDQIFSSPSLSSSSAISKTSNHFYSNLNNNNNNNKINHASCLDCKSSTTVIASENCVK